MESRLLSGISAGIFAGIFSLALAFPAYSQSASDMRILLSSEGKVLYADEQNSIMVIDYP
ncbi:MAG: hypothetical protein L6366_06920 [Candidatus Omnitrophica bacterium]|nr:hypothetical protein [Candidatus Omnitrophota bacterium]